MKKLVKIAFVMLGAIALAFVTACNKENENGNGNNNGGNNGGGGGQSHYTIDKKIQSAYYSYSYNSETSGRYKVSDWTWRSDGLLDYVDAYEGEESNSVLLRLNFSYDNNNHVNRVDCFQYNMYLTYTYGNDGLLNMMDLYYKDYETGNTINVANCAATYRDGYLNMLNVTVYDTDFYYKKACKYMNPFSMLFPGQITQSMSKFEERLAQNRNGNETIFFTIQLTWNEGNITNIYGSGMGESINITLQYDNTNSFIYGFLLGQYNSVSLVKNNPTRVNISEGSHTDTALVNYACDNSNYPTTITLCDASYQNERLMVYIEY